MSMFAFENGCCHENDLNFGSFTIMCANYIEFEDWNPFSFVCEFFVYLQIELIVQERDVIH